MRKRTLLWLPLGLLIVGLWQGTPSQEPADSAAPSERLLHELSGVNESMGQLVRLLGAHLANQDIELVLKRIELRQSRLAPLEREVRGADEDAYNLKAEVKRMRQMHDEWEDRLRDQLREGNEAEAETTRNMMSDVEMAIRTETARLEELQRRVMSLEDELADGRDEIAILDDLLRQLLDSRE